MLYLVKAFLCDFGVIQDSLVAKKYVWLIKLFTFKYNA
jgi:hypothetical protein